MTIIIASKEIYRGTITPDGLSVEAVLLEMIDQSDEYVVEGYVDLAAMQDGDAVILREYLAIDGTSQRVFLMPTFYNEQDEPVVRFHSKTIPRDGKYKVTLTQTKGTVRSYPYFFVVLKFGSA